MKRTVGVLSFILAFSSFATNYTGKGKWLSSEGNSGEYSVGANIEKQENENVSISQTFTVGDDTWDFKVLIQKLNENFYEIVNADSNEVIGHGYCFTMEVTGDKLCHSEGWAESSYTESTIKITSKNIYRMGSKTNAEGEKVIWMDELEPQPEPGAGEGAPEAL